MCPRTLGAAELPKQLPHNVPVEVLQNSQTASVHEVGAAKTDFETRNRPDGADIVSL